MSAKRIAFGQQWWRFCISNVLHTQRTHIQPQNKLKARKRFNYFTRVFKTNILWPFYCLLSFQCNRRESVRIFPNKCMAVAPSPLATLVPGQFTLDALTSFWSNSCVYFSCVPYSICFQCSGLYLFFFSVARMWCLFGRPNRIKAKRQCTRERELLAEWIQMPYF